MLSVVILRCRLFYLFFFLTRFTSLFFLNSHKQGLIPKSIQVLNIFYFWLCILNVQQHRARKLKIVIVYKKKNVDYDLPRFVLPVVNAKEVFKYRGKDQRRMPTAIEDLPKYLNYLILTNDVRLSSGTSFSNLFATKTQTIYWNSKDNVWVGGKKFSKTCIKLRYIKPKSSIIVVVVVTLPVRLFFYLKTSPCGLTLPPR